MFIGGGFFMDGDVVVLFEMFDDLCHEVLGRGSSGGE